jgi:saccharopine dehydrogenase-like NADP-dependent oxidoreductase
MNNILVLGAGKSATVMIDYLLKNAKTENWNVSIADINVSHLASKIAKMGTGESFVIDITNTEQRQQAIQKADIVISLLPVTFHTLVANDCLTFSKNLVTASYVNEVIAKMHDEVKAKGIIFMKEIGLDPGIDHMSAMLLIDEIKEKGGEITSFKSYCGGLVAPEYDTNPWNYKFTWNPRNVVLAGQSTAKYIEKGEYKYLPYNRLFSNTQEISLKGYEPFEGYANRDSLSYRKAYGLENIPTMLRGTLRRKGYSEAWNCIVQLGMADDTFVMENSEKLTNRSFLNAFLPFSEKLTVEEKFCDVLKLTKADDVYKKFEWLELFEDKAIGLKNATPAQLLQAILEPKLKLNAGDKDMIVMQHLIEYTLNSKKYQLISSMVIKGDDEINTAMAKTVGLPVAIATKLILKNKITEKGVVIPVSKEIYSQILPELTTYGVVFEDEILELAD